MYGPSFYSPLYHNSCNSFWAEAVSLVVDVFFVILFLNQNRCTSFYPSITEVFVQNTVHRRRFIVGCREQSYNARCLSRSAEEWLSTPADCTPAPWLNLLALQVPTRSGLFLPILFLRSATCCFLCFVKSFYGGFFIEPLWRIGLSRWFLQRAATIARPVIFYLEWVLSTWIRT